MRMKTKIEGQENFDKNKLMVVKYEDHYELRTSDGKLLEKARQIFCKRPSRYMQPDSDEYLYVQTMTKDYDLIKSQLYYLDKMLCEKTGGIDINFLTLDLNTRYVCLQKNRRRDDQRWEVVYDMQEQKEITPRVNTIYPSPQFPTIPYYKCSDHSRGNLDYLLVKWPENKVIMRSKDQDFNPIDRGIFGGLSDFFYIEYSKDYYFLDGDTPVFIDSGPLANSVFGDLDKKMSHRTIIKRYFKGRK